MPIINKLFNLRKTYNKLKIDNALKLYAKKYRINKCLNKFTVEQKDSILDYYSTSINKIIIIQK